MMRRGERKKKKKRMRMDVKDTYGHASLSFVEGVGQVLNLARKWCWVAVAVANAEPGLVRMQLRSLPDLSPHSQFLQQPHIIPTPILAAQAHPLTLWGFVDTREAGDQFAILVTIFPFRLPLSQRRFFHPGIIPTSIALLKILPFNLCMITRSIERCQLEILVAFVGRVGDY